MSVYCERQAKYRMSGLPFSRHNWPPITSFSSKHFIKVPCKGVNIQRFYYHETWSDTFETVRERKNKSWYLPF
jgi:hypothetical protein